MNSTPDMAAVSLCNQPVPGSSPGVGFCSPATTYITASPCNFLSRGRGQGITRSGGFLSYNPDCENYNSLLHQVAGLGSTRTPAGLSSDKNDSGGVKNYGDPLSRARGRGQRDGVIAQSYPSGSPKIPLPPYNPGCVGVAAKRSPRIPNPPLTNGERRECPRCKQEYWYSYKLRNDCPNINCRIEEEIKNELDKVR